MARHTVGQSIKLVLWNVHSRLGLAEERHNGLARVATNDGDDSLLWVSLASNALDKGLGADNVEGGNTEELLGVEDTGSLENLGGNWHSAVDGVGDDEHVGVWAVLGDTLDQVTHNSGIDLEEVVAGHARLACIVSALAGTGIELCVWAVVRGMPAGMTTMSAPVKAFFMPSSFGR